MIVIPEKRALLYKLRQPERITTVIPTAKQLDAYHVAVPHRPDEVRVLRQLGLEAPDPFPQYYKFPGKTPFEAQRVTANFLVMHNRAFCLNSMGTGKTVSSLWAADYLRSVKQIRRVLIVCPLSTMERTWADEIFRTFPDRTVQVLHGTRDRRKKLLATDADYYIINIDGVKIIADDLAKRADIDLIIIDELAMARNSTTDRWKALNVVINEQTPRRVWGLTGMPTPNAPTDAWAQVKLINPTISGLPRYFNKARETLMKQVGMYKWLVKDDANETIKTWMQPAIRYALEDCVDLPPHVFIEREIELTPEQRKVYEDMLKKLKAEYEGNQILAINEAVKANKLVQIACGTVYKDDGEVDVPAAPRIEVLKEVIEQSEGKTIVFVPLTGALLRVAEELRKEFDVGVIYGETPKYERDEIFAGFQNGASPRVLVANPATMSHGLTLTAATTVVWYAPVHSNDVYEQANARVRRPGQTRATVVVHLSGTEIERKIYDRLKNKQSMQNVLLDIMRKMR